MSSRKDCSTEFYLVLNIPYYVRSNSLSKLDGRLTKDVGRRWQAGGRRAAEAQYIQVNSVSFCSTSQVLLFSCNSQTLSSLFIIVIKLNIGGSYPFFLTLRRRCMQINSSYESAWDNHFFKKYHWYTTLWWFHTKHSCFKIHPHYQVLAPSTAVTTSVVRCYRVTNRPLRAVLSSPWPTHIVIANYSAP